MDKKEIDIDKLLQEGGDIYQKVADFAGITREDAKILLFPYLYGDRKLHGKENPDNGTATI